MTDSLSTPDAAADRLRALYEDAVASPGFTFRGPAVPLVLRILEDQLHPQAAGGPSEELQGRVRQLLGFVRATGHVPTDELADVLGSVLVEQFLDD